MLASLQEKLNIGNEISFMAGSSLAGGVARAGETCGALTGAIMAIGLVAGRRNLEDLDTYQSCMALAREARQEFLERIGHTLCAEIQRILLGRTYHLWDEEQRQRFHDDGGHSREACPGVCGKASRIAAEIILREQDRGV
ncbi:C_GCAxxG_C_C family protein [candidate division TA06 bacterium]|uniref:C_GCAxxG_C_C family protein n=1 Tax=candidate division TA06 bacterium TaxID=2250710 RepID=A0A523XNF5_UNCT6|nr:MAG: C_GCAxxG_C_C family protein [candidate division TA06 bacterium]